MVQSAQQIMQRGRSADAARLDPNFAYLRTTMGRHVGFAWLGSTERSPQGLIEIYYTGSGEMLRLHNGRIVGAAGFKTEWRAVRLLNAPSWSAAAEAREPVTFQRVRDVMPGYRSDVRDELVVRRIPAPGRSALRGVDPSKLMWFEEVMRPRAPTTAWFARGRGEDSDITLPAVKYAVEIAEDKETVVYSEQCLAKDLCFTWQRWSEAMQQVQRAASR